MTVMTTAPAHAQGLGEESIWFKLSALQRGDAPNPMIVLMQLAERYGGGPTGGGDDGSGERAPKDPRHVH